MNPMTLEQRIARLEDLEAIRQLKARYCEVCDDDHNPDRIITLFAEDGIWEGRGIGRAEGHAQLRELFEGFRRSISFSQHMVMNPIIEVTGDRASGTWYFFGPFTFRQGNQAKWQAARYVDDYVKRDGVWKFQHLRVKGPGMSADYQSGWAGA
ncbi:MAG: nuclear transport factor 2 family protein [Pseudomonadales bacterium]|nr:nuclear transport factor 2 family protein [Pseudomonadales bacterium]